MKEDLNAFLEKLRRIALPGFSAYTQDTYTDDYQIAFDVLSDLGRQLREAAHDSHAARFSAYRDRYYDLFKKYNMALAKKVFKQKVKTRYDAGETLDSARINSAVELWEDPRFRKWLPVKIKLKENNGDRYIELVGDKSYASSLYVTIEELSEIKKSGVNPWDFVQRRSSEDSSNSTYANGPNRTHNSEGRSRGVDY